MKRIPTALLAFLLVHQLAWGEEAVFLQGVQLAPPDGFRNADTFTGLQQDESGSSIVVNVFKGPYAEISAGFTEQGLKGQGMMLVEKKGVSIGGEEGILLKVKQTAYSIAFMKWILLFGNQEKTALVTATFPEESAGKASESLKKAVLSARWSRLPQKGR